MDAFTEALHEKRNLSWANTGDAAVAGVDLESEQLRDGTIDAIVHSTALRNMGNGLRLYDEGATEIQTTTSDRLDLTYRRRVRDLQRDAFLDALRYDALLIEESTDLATAS